MKAIPELADESLPDPSRREFAAERARTARRTIPGLIELLASEDLRTRFIAEMCLRDATDT
ncbi:MAG TPA: hypothetical protein VF591_20875 [Pyrinomonadaceae bacterium]|jgi:hypothetical protein